ncbi:hypothetical protein [Candidatus Halocynthiibacter alkanivorans]|uniref:hypothetical protein n=1 Tax=Candidatus Halocynthiibacter alkanivorans TaxID=2267619 RepID=UPI00109CC0C3|nr:hypothetical protein [Candidatus Halocynthiibacter alkanivorans]
MKLVNVLAMTSVMLMGPAMVGSVNLLGFQDVEAAWAGGNGKGGGGGKSSEKSRGKSEARGGGKPVFAGQGNRTASVKAPKAVKATQGSLSSQLKALNSLNRNINGLMNSSDPKMEPFRDFVSNSAELELLIVAKADAEAALGETSAALAAALAALEVNPETAEADLVTLLETPDLSQEAIDEITAAQELLEQQAEDQAALDEASDDAAAAAEATSEEAMIEAMVASLNATGAGPVTVDDITPEMTAWVAEQLGVGEDQHGLIDDWLAKL